MAAVLKAWFHACLRVRHAFYPLFIRYLPNIEVLDGLEITNMDNTMRGSLNSRSSFFNMSQGGLGSPLFQKVPLNDPLAMSIGTPSTPRTPGFGIVTYDSRRPGSARSVRGGFDMSTTFSGVPGTKQQAPVMRPHSARTGILAWSCSSNDCATARTALYTWATRGPPLYWHLTGMLQPLSQ